MSRMTKFLKQTCRLERYVVEDGRPKMNKFGELQYSEPEQLKCRRELECRDIQVGNGSIIRSTSVYYLDERVEIKPNYRLDGSVIVAVKSYVNGLGAVEGYEVYV